MKSLLFWISGMTAMLAGLYFFVGPPSWMVEGAAVASQVADEAEAWVPESLTEDEVVTVFLVGKRSSVNLMRRAVDAKRILADTQDGIALVEGRIVATGEGAVSETLRLAGWIDRPIELATLPSRQSSRSSSAAASEADSEQAKRLNELMGKDRLTAGEQMFLLQAMNDGAGDY